MRVITVSGGARDIYVLNLRRRLFPWTTVAGVNAISHGKLARFIEPA